MSKGDQPNICYWCGKAATSREHVPPKCLFPEEKDVKEIYERSFRNNLITVPSCEEHNLGKSQEDEYLMVCLSSRVGNNGVAYVHSATKGTRARRRKPTIVKVVSEGIVELGGSEYPVQWVSIDNTRLVRSFESIARALYFHEQKKVFVGQCTIVSRIFSHPSEHNWSEFNARACQLIEKEQPHWEQEIKGHNTDVFTYQFSPVDGFKTQTLCLTFYKATKVYVILSALSQEEKEQVKPKLAFAGKIAFGELW